MNCFTNTRQFSLLFHPSSSHLHPLQVENCDSNSRLVVDKDENGKFRPERVNYRSFNPFSAGIDFYSQSPHWKSEIFIRKTLVSWFTYKYFSTLRANPFIAKLFNLNFHSLEVVSRWRDPQLPSEWKLYRFDKMAVNCFQNLADWCHILSLPSLKGGT